MPASKGRGHYFAGEKGPEFVSSGCTVLDCVLGGGYPLGRVVNIVGDKSAGKTLLAIEACANFAQTYPSGHIWYREAEAAFDVGYASELGLPVERVDFGPDGADTQWETVEDIFEDLSDRLSEVEAAAEARTKKRAAALSKKEAADTEVLARIATEEYCRCPGLYVVDSLDALSSRTEMERKIDKGSYGTDKASVMSELFRRLKKRIKRAHFVIIIISQIRDRIGITFGEKYTRTGGHALDFYASQILWLHHKANVKSTVKGVDRITGVRVRAKCKKNKIGPPHRECEFVLRFSYGIDDLEACMTYLTEVGLLGLVPGLAKKDKEAIPQFLRASARLDGDELRTRQREVADAVRRGWREVEDGFRPARRKYG